MWRALQKGWSPPENVSETEYQYLKAAQDIEDPALVAFVGFCCSYSGKYFAGFAKCSKMRNYAHEGRINLGKQIPFLQNVDFRCCSYQDQDLSLPPESLIYCDPPYMGTTGYKMGFDNDAFWQWCRHKAAEGHTVFISEYSAPADFICILEVVHFTTVDSNKDKRIEKLFTFNELL